MPEAYETRDRYFFFHSCSPQVDQCMIMSVLGSVRSHFPTPVASPGLARGKAIVIGTPKTGTISICTANHGALMQ